MGFSLGEKGANAVGARWGSIYGKGGGGGNVAPTHTHTHILS